MRRLRRQALAVAALLVALTSAALPLDGQEPEPVFELLRGHWCGEGTLMGRPARFSMGWRRHAGFAVLTFANAFADTTGGVVPVLSAGAVYRMSAERPEAVWLDSRGVRIDIRWEASDSTLVGHWTAPEETGRTSYRVRSSAAIDVLDEVRGPSGWATFGTASYRRVDGDAIPPSGQCPPLD